MPLLIKGKEARFQKRVRLRFVISILSSKLIHSVDYRTISSPTPNTQCEHPPQLTLPRKISLYSSEEERIPIFWHLSETQRDAPITLQEVVPCANRKSNKENTVPPLAYDSDEGISKRVISSTPLGVFEFCQEKLVDPRRSNQRLLSSAAF
ncbi:hypothetical protein TNCV_3691031 [Trichonephila clavipes]|nr:hypothetical protein TNCV_3691031 [Trichonephila clavipes]